MSLRPAIAIIVLFGVLEGWIPVALATTPLTLAPTATLAEASIADASGGCAVVPTAQPQPAATMAILPLALLWLRRRSRGWARGRQKRRPLRNRAGER